MDDLLLHIRVSKKLKEQLQVLIDAGYFNNQTEIVREGIRDVLRKYKEELSPGLPLAQKMKKIQ
jgi:Arc/MetJ-type ribon-helix-helix transcriptional regulator